MDNDKKNKDLTFLTTREPWVMRPSMEICTKGGKVIALVGYDRRDNCSYVTPETVANARLIAAAPELLKYLKAMVQYTDAIPEPSIIYLAKQAIKKATE